MVVKGEEDNSSYDREMLFKSIYELYHPKISLIVSQFIVIDDDAKEVVQDTFMKFWDKMDEIDLNDNIVGYLFRVARNLSLDYLRKKKTILSHESSYHQQINRLNYITLSDEPSSQLIEKELQQILNNSIESLPDKCKIIFKKSRYEGYNHKEISKELNISTRTVEHQIYKALKHIKRRLKNHLSLFF